MGQGAEYQMHKLSQEVERLTAENERLYQEWKVAAGANDGFLQAIKQLHEIVDLGITTNAQLRAENERLSLENQSLREKIIAAGYLPHFDANEIKDVEQQIKRLLERANSGNAHLMAENERLTAALVECQEAFESGRTVGAVVGELEY